MSNQPNAENYFTTHITHTRQISVPSAGFEPAISAGEQPQTHALDRLAAATGNYINSYGKLCNILRKLHSNLSVQLTNHDFSPRYILVLVAVCNVFVFVCDCVCVCVCVCVRGGGMYSA
jgi:hypothetical protein